MAMLAFDTHKVIKDLQAAGFTEAQAEGVTRVVREAQEARFADLPTKADHAELRTDIETLRLTTKADIEALRQSTKADIEALRQSTKADIETLRQSTKADIEALRQSTKADIETLRQSTKTDLAEVKADLLKWMIGAIGAQTVVILGALVALARMLPR